MSTPIIEMEGTVEEIQIRLSDFIGQRLHVTVLSLGISENTPPQGKSLTERLLAMSEAMPPEECAKMPSDLAEQHDHTIYG